MICFVTVRGTVRVRSAQDISKPFPAKNRSNIFMCMCMCMCIIQKIGLKCMKAAQMRVFLCVYVYVYVYNRFFAPILV